MNAAALRKLTVDEFVRWVERHGDDRKYELVDGVTVMMAPERSRHVDAKMNAYMVLREAVRKVGSGCIVKGDGIGLAIDEWNSRQPDVSIQCKPIDSEAMFLDEPVVVIEIVLPTSGARDTGAKLVDYFRVPSIRHYLIIDTYEGVVVHHRRDAHGGDIATAIRRDGAITLDPPGIEVATGDLLAWDR